MTKEETDLIGEAIDFYNLNHFKGQKTKKQLVKLKKRIKALTIPIVIPRYSVSLVYVKNITNGQETALRCFITNADSEEEALGKAVIYFTDEMRSFNLSNKVVLRANEG